MWTKNEVTGQLEMSFQGELVSVGENVLENSNGTLFRIGSVRLPNGKVKSCRIYEKNYEKGMTIGVSHLCTATQYIDATGAIAVDVQMSHLTQAERATLADFGVEVDNKQLAEQSI